MQITPHEIRTEIRAWYEKHGERPYVTTNSWWARVSSRLGLWNHTLHTLCDEMGLPGGNDFDRTMDRARTEIQTHYEEHGTRPTRKSTKEWTRWDGWLRQRDHTLRTLSIEMGLPGKKDYERTVDRVRVEIQAYYEKHGKRPTRKSTKEWGRWDKWLGRRHTTLLRFCDEMGLPGGRKYDFDRTMDRARDEIQAYYEEHGKRPKLGTGREWKRWDSWLHDQGTSLRTLCIEMDLPGGIDLDRTIPRARIEIQAYYDEHGTRPDLSTGREWRRWDSWLHDRGTSLRGLCDEMGLPGGIDLDRTVVRARDEIQAYYEEHGERPCVTTGREWDRWNRWLHDRGTSLFRLCNAMGLPKRTVRPNR